MNIDLQLRQIQIRRASMLKVIRQGHEAQMERMNDTAMQAFMQDIGHNMSPAQVMTMLQDLQEIGYVKFETRFDEERERMVAERIMLTSQGTIIVLRRVNNDFVRFD